MIMITVNWPICSVCPRVLPLSEKYGQDECRSESSGSVPRDDTTVITCSAEEAEEFLIHPSPGTGHSARTRIA